MRVFKYVAFLFYRYYSEGKWSNAETAFFRTKCSLTLLAWFHLVQITLLMKKTELIFQSQLSTIISMIPIFILISLFLRENELEELREKYSYEWDKVFDSNVWLVVYSILSVTLMIALMVWNRK